MALTPRLDLRQSQQLVMTPQLQQAIKLLQLNNIELAAFVAEELERNPLLELAEEEGGASEAASEGAASEADDGADISDPGDDGVLAADAALNTDKAVSDAEAPLDADLSETVYNHDSAADQGMALGGDGLGLNGAGRIEGGGGERETSFEATLSETVSLQDHLWAQLGCAVDDPALRMIGGHIIDLVDEAGYVNAAELADMPARLGCADADVERALSLLQSFDPAGVCARNLAECLKIQQRERDRLDPAMNALLDNLDLLARRDLAALKRLCQISAEDLADMIREVQALNPKPGLAFGGETAQTVAPDIFIQRNAAGAWHVELNSATLPRILVNRRYYSELTTHNGDKQAKAFLSECLNSANWLIKALDQRARTILKVATELVRQQEAFFEHGVRHLRPLNLRAIADAINMHESTVSRVTANKFLACSRGVFELKYFFTAAIASASGAADHSAEAVRDRIRELIDSESPDAVLSDDRIVEILQAEEIDIARRTVAKYREAMRIPSSVQRRRAKKLAG
ncbi:MAG: RNA polymerase factor sigma-54 [Pseudomonadota bacterium]